MQFRILGPLDVTHGARTLPLRAAKQRAFLAILLLNANRFVTSERLIADLWAGPPPETALKIVQNYVSRLRRLLDEAPAAAGAPSQQVLVTGPRGYMLRVGADELDSQRFERLCEEGRTALAAGRHADAATIL